MDAVTLTLAKAHTDETALGQGAVQIPGPQGKDGFTPYIGTNGNWWIGNNDTGVKPQEEILSLSNAEIQTILNNL